MARAVPHHALHKPLPARAPFSLPKFFAFRLRFVLLWIALALVFAWICMLAWKWPFTRKAVTTALQHEIGKPVRIGVFHPTFFPLGYVAEDVRFINQAANSGSPALTIRKLAIAANYSDLLFARKRIEQASITGLHVVFPSIPGSRKKEGSTHQSPPRFSAVGQIKIEDSSVEFSSAAPNADPFKITIKRAALDNVNRRDPSPFHAEFATNEPSGTVQATGQFGPWSWDEPGQTRLAGSFAFKQADLSTVGKLEGLLDAQGKFSGLLGQVACSGVINVPQFGTSTGKHALPLSTTFHATVDGLNGDVILNHAESRLNGTVIQSQGEIKGDGEKTGKTARLHLSVAGGQVGDILLLFTRSEQPSMKGEISLQADAELPPGNSDFLQRLKLQGNFGMNGSRFTKGSTQAPIDLLSKSAEGMSRKEEKEDTATVLSDIKGHVFAQNGAAALSRVSFTVPGAEANLSGTYNLLNKAVYLEGTLRTTGKLSDTTSGWKEGLLKVMGPFLKKHSVTVVPFKITGVAPHSAFALDLARKQRL